MKLFRKKKCLAIILLINAVLLIALVFTMYEGAGCFAYFKHLESRGCLFLKGNDDYLRGFWGDHSEKGYTLITSQKIEEAFIFYCESGEVKVCAAVLREPSCYLGKYNDDVAFSCVGNGKAVVITYDSFSRKTCEELIPQATIFSEKYIGREFASCEEQEKTVNEGRRLTILEMSALISVIEKMAEGELPPEACEKFFPHAVRLFEKFLGKKFVSCDCEAQENLLDIIKKENFSSVLEMRELSELFEKMKYEKFSHEVCKEHFLRVALLSKKYLSMKFGSCDEVKSLLDGSENPERDDEAK